MAEPLSHVAYLGIVAVIAAIAVRQALPYEQVLAAVALLYRMQPYASEFEGQRLHLATLLGPIRAIDDLVRLGSPMEAAGKTALPSEGSVRFDGVTFAYPGQRHPCLDRVSFTIPPRGWTRLAGESGAGKSTIINLLLRLYEPQRGRILIGDTPLTMLDVESWRSRIAVAGQDVELIDGTIAENVMLGRTDASEAELMEVLFLSGLDMFVTELRDGAGTRIGERGLNLSGGQRQRLGLARALLRRPALLILDEATSALDSASESAIFARLHAALEGTAVLVIGHRIPADLPIRHAVTLARGGTVQQDGAGIPVA